MPKPRKGESQRDFVSRCVPIVLNDGTTKDNKQAVAICYSIFKEHGKKSDSASASIAAGKSWLTLNHKSAEKLYAMVRAGDYVDQPWSFSAEDGNAILGENGDNWNEFADWNLGIDHAGDKQSKDSYGYPFGKGGKVYLSALRSIRTRASQQGAIDIFRAAGKALDLAKQKETNMAKAAAPELCDLPLGLRADVAIEAARGADEAGGPSSPTFSMVAYTGGQLELENWDHPVVVDLSGLSGTDKSRPVLRDHDQGKIVGHTTTIQNDGRKIAVQGVISGHNAHAEEVVGSGKDKFPWQVSIGAKVVKKQFVPEGRSIQVNGQTFNGPIYVARQTVLGEVSFVALGADDNTSARIAARIAAAAKELDMEFAQWLKAKGFALDTLNETQRASLQASYDLEIEAEKMKDTEGAADDSTSADDSVDDETVAKSKKAKASARRELRANAALDIADFQAEIDKQIKAARAKAIADVKRIGEVEAKCLDFKDRVDPKKLGEIQAQAIEGDWDTDKTELHLLRAAREGKPSKSNFGSAFNINTGAGMQMTPEIVASACALSGGVSEKYALSGLDDSQKQMVGDRAIKAHVTSIYGLCAMIAAANGVHLHSPRMDDDVIRAMFRLDSKLNLTADGGGAPGFSTLSLSGITENILNKAMLEAYGAILSVVPDIAYETDTNDFKQFKRYRLTASGIFQSIGPTGELKSISLQDESYPNQVATKGVILTIGREMLINDDMGALTQAPTLIGRGAALIREQAVFTTLLTGKTTVAPGASVGQTANGFNFFSSGAKNYMSGASSAMSVTSLTTAVQKFLEQKDANGQPIMLSPDRLLVPPALRTTALSLFNGAELVVTALGSTSAKSTEPNINAHKGVFRPIVSPYLGAQSPVAGSTDTGFYLLTNPAGGFAPVQVAYLRGQRVPVIERGETNFNTLGIAMRSYYDFGVALHDYRTAVLSDGV
jgi:hypothetical protein